MQLRVLKRIQSAVESITDCTAPVIEVGGIRAAADGLRSPYASRKTILWEVAETRPGEMIASSSRYTLVIQTIYAPENPPEADVVGGFVGIWEGGYVPTEIVRPVLDLAESFGLHLDGDDAALVRAYVLLPRLAAYHLGQPVFWLVNEDNEPLDITEYVRDLVAEVGGIRLFRLDASEWDDDHWLLGAVPLWTDEHRVFGVARNDFGGMGDIRRADAVPVVAAMYRGETVFLANIDGPATLVAEDGGRVTVDGYCLAIMPARQMALARV